MESLTVDQSKIMDHIVLGENLFITGGAGVGKTHVIHSLIDSLQHKNIGITSTTGISAILIKGATLHSFLGIGLGVNSTEVLHGSIMKRKQIRDRWQKLEILVIDEISMLTAALFDKLEELARLIRDSVLPFGGIQLILSGDFCQLPPIGVMNGREQFCFESESWPHCIGQDNVILLTEIIRQKDKQFQRALNNIRMGRIDDDTKAIFAPCIGRKFNKQLGVKPTKLFPLNNMVDIINEKELMKTANTKHNQQEFYQYDRETTGHPKPLKNRAIQAVIDRYVKSCIVPEKLELCVGCQVMLVHNLTPTPGDAHQRDQHKLVNGSRGVVKRFINDLPFVSFTNGKECIIDYHTWDIEQDDVKIGEMTQIPLRLGYAFSIHKSQGCSLDLVSMDLSKIFDYGMGYVAMSRAHTLEGLSIKAIDWNQIKVHPKVLEYYESIEK